MSAVNSTNLGLNLLQSYFQPPGAEVSEKVQVPARIPIFKVSQVAWVRFSAAQLKDNAQRLSDGLDQMESRSAVAPKKTVNQLLINSESYLKFLSTKLSSGDLKEAYSHLRGRVYSLRARILPIEDRAELPLDRDAFADFLQQIEANKKSHPVLKQLAEKDQVLSESDLHTLDHMKAHYPSITRMLCEDPVWREAFVNSVIVRGISPDVFAQFINTTTSLSSLIMTRFGHFKEFLKIEENAKGFKSLTIPYIDHHGKQQRVNLHDTKAILNLEGGFTLSVGEMLKVLKQKPVVMGPLGVFPEGIRSFEMGQFGWMQKNGSIKLIDLTQKDWIQQLPAWQVLSTEEANKKYGPYLHGEALDGKNMMVALAVSAKDKNRQDLLGVHGYQVILVPMGDGRYNVLPLARVPKVSPDLRSKWQTVSFVANTAVAEIQYDTNYFTDNRVHGMVCYSLSPEQGAYYMNEIIAPDIQSGRDGTLLFQFADQNCIQWVISRWKKLQEKYPLPFALPCHRISLLRTDPSHPALAWLVTTASKLARIFCRIFMNGVLFLLGARRGRTVNGEFHSLWKSKNFNANTKYKIFTPMPLFKYSGGLLGEQCSMHAKDPNHQCTRLTTHLHI